MRETRLTFGMYAVSFAFAVLSLFLLMHYGGYAFVRPDSIDRVLLTFRQGERFCYIGVEGAFVSTEFPVVPVKCSDVRNWCLKYANSTEWDGYFDCITKQNAARQNNGTYLCRDPVYRCRVMA